MRETRPETGRMRNLPREAIAVLCSAPGYQLVIVPKPAQADLRHGAATARSKAHVRKACRSASSKSAASNPAQSGDG